jgi:hypothetical protein
MNGTTSAALCSKSWAAAEVVVVVGCGEWNGRVGL